MRADITPSTMSWMDPTQIIGGMASVQGWSLVLLALSSVCLSDTAADITAIHSLGFSDSAGAPAGAAKGYLVCPSLAKPQQPGFPAYSLGVDPFIGAGGEGFGCAALNPGAQLPHGPMRVGPDTSLDTLRIPYRTFGGYR
jgi:hypothetical protein